MNSRYWPYAFEVSPTQGDILIANPVGNQEGLGILGFCYVLPVSGRSGFHRSDHGDSRDSR